MPVTTLNSLPAEILINISNILDGASLVAFSQLNRRLRSLSRSSSSFWLETLLRERDLVIPLEPPLHRDMRERSPLELQLATTHAIQREKHLSSDFPIPRSVTRLKAVFPTEDFDHACASYLFHSTGEWIFTVSVSRVFRVYSLRTEVPAYELRDYEFRDKNDISGRWGSNLGYVFTIDEIDRGVVLMAFIAYKRPKDGGADDQDSSSWEPEVLVLRINLDMKARSASAKELARCPFDYVPSMMVLSGPRLFVANQANSSSIEGDEDTTLRLFSWPERRYVPLPEMLPSVYLNAYPDYFLSLGIINESTIALQILTYTPSRTVDDDDDGGNAEEYTPLSDTDHFLIATIGLPSPPSPGLHFLPRDAMIHHEYNGPNVNDVVIWICDKVAHLEGEIDSHAWTVFEITLDFAQLFQFQFQRRKGVHSVGGGGDEAEADSFRYNKSEKPNMNTERIETISHGGGGGGGGRDKLLHIGFPIQQEPLNTPNPPPAAAPPPLPPSPSPPPLKFDLVQKRITNFPFFRLLRSLGKGFRVARLEMMPDLSSPGSSRSTIYPIIYDTRTCPQFDTSRLMAWSPLVPSDVTVSLQSSISVDDEQEQEQADVDLSPESRLYLFDGVEATGIFVFVLNDGDVCVLRYGHA